MQLLINLILFLILSIPAWATTWYVRDGGAAYGVTSITCNGLYNVAYTTGNGPNCALNDLSWVLGSNDAGATPTTGLMMGEDTAFVEGDSDITPGTQAIYIAGWGMANGGFYCNGGNSQFQRDCLLLNIPAGSAGHPTSIIGTGTHKPQIEGVFQNDRALTANNNYITLQNLEITSHASCAYNDPDGGCPAGDGILLSGDQMTFTDVYVHGFSRYGINTGQMGSATFTRTYVIGNGWGGITVGNGGSTSVTGTLTFNQPIVEWNGCVEAYPVSGGIDNPSNYAHCFGQGSGGYGDGLAFGSTGTNNAGNWTLVGPGSISFNTQDGLDVLHGNGNGTIQADKMRFEGNAGQQFKANALDVYLTNSIVIGDCGWWYGSTQAASGALHPGDSCRALGNAVVFNVTQNSLANINNNTILSNGNFLLVSIDQNNTDNCTGTVINLKNNIILGGYYWLDDSNFNVGGGNTKVGFIYNNGDSGNSGPCTNVTWTEDYNVISGISSATPNCGGAHDKCNTVPGFLAGTFPMGTSGGGLSTYYQGQAGVTLMPIASNSAAVSAGVNGLTYWNTSNDYYNNTETNPPVSGALIFGSLAVNGFTPCLFNSDCSSDICTANVCTGNTPPSTTNSNMIMLGNIVISGNIKP